MLAPTRAQQQHSAAESSTSMAPVFELGGQFETRSLAALAAELFQDPALTGLCDKGLNGTLQRTKDGATAESRIQELAGYIPITGRAAGHVLCYTLHWHLTQQGLVSGIDAHAE